jgi:FkbM family methyltransferase
MGSSLIGKRYKKTCRNRADDKRHKFKLEKKLRNMIATLLVRAGGMKLLSRTRARHLYKVMYSSIEGDIVVKTRLGPCIHVNYMNHVEREIANDNFEREYLSLFYSKIHKGDFVIDVGANIGYFTLVASRIVGDNGRVYSFEPVETNYKRLLRNLNLNNVRNVKAFNIGLSDRNETLSMIVPEDDPAESSISSKSWSELRWGLKRKNGKINAKFQTFDDFSKMKNIDKILVVKIDVEGAELKVLKGMRNFLKINGLIMFVEILPLLIEQNGGSIAELIEVLVDSGFKEIYSFEKRKTTSLLEKPDIVENCIGRIGGNFVLSKRSDDLSRL